MLCTLCTKVIIFFICLEIFVHFISANFLCYQIVRAEFNFYYTLFVASKDVAV